MAAFPHRGAFAFEEAPFGELTHGLQAFEALSSHRGHGGASVEINFTCMDAEPSLPGGARRHALCWVSPSGFIPRTHVFPLRVNGEVRQTSRVGHLYVVLDLDRLATPLGEHDVPCATLPPPAVVACYVPRRLDPTLSPHVLLVSVLSDAVARLAAADATTRVRALFDPRDGAYGALHWALADEAAALCDAKLLATYVANAARPERRAVRVANANFARGVAPSRGARALLFALGFRAVDGETIRLDGADRRRLDLLGDVAAMLRAHPEADPPWAKCAPGAGEEGRGGFLQSDARWNRPGFRGRAPPPPPPGSAPSSNGRWGRG